jgi:peroxiredoxin
MALELQTTKAPDFNITDWQGRKVQLSDYQGIQHVVLVFNRGFFWPFCQQQMAQLRQSYHEFQSAGAEIVVVGPEARGAFERYWKKENLPFVGIPDQGNTLAELYRQEANRLKLGRLPALMVIDKEGYLRFQRHGKAMWDIPSNDEILNLLNELNYENAETGAQDEDLQIERGAVVPAIPNHGFSFLRGCV